MSGVTLNKVIKRYGDVQVIHGVDLEIEDGEFFVLLGQLISAAAIDHFGLFGAQVKPLSFMRGAGIALMAAGVVLTQKA